MTTTIAAAKKRIDSIDQLRGIIMIIMALDHVRDFFHNDAMLHDPTNPQTTTPILFFTRWITHFCAPLFVFLAGTSAYLTGTKRTKQELSLFLLKRGGWLMVLELIIFNFIFSFDPAYHVVAVQVIWVTGMSMVLLAALIFLPMPVIFAMGLFIVAGHNLLDKFNTAGASSPSVWWSLFHQQAFLPMGQGRAFLVFYPFIPWPGIMLLGYCAGSLYRPGYDPVKRRKQLLSFGLIAVGVFFILRYINVYGDLFPWSRQQTTTATVLSFFNVTKYPPSLLYCCMTIGPGLIVLALLEKMRGTFLNFVVVYGRVPMFYYLMHFTLIHVLCMIVFFATGHTMADTAGAMMMFRPNNFGFPLWVVYMIWIGIVVFLYPFCKRYSIYKANNKQWWLSYL